MVPVALPRFLIFSSSMSNQSLSSLMTHSLPVRGARHGLYWGLLVFPSLFPWWSLIMEKDWLAFHFIEERWIVIYSHLVFLAFRQLWSVSSRLVSQVFHRFRILNLIGDAICTAFWETSSSVYHLHLKRKVLWSAWTLVWLLESMQKNERKVTIYKIYVAQLLFNFMHDEYIITIVCYNLITIYIFWGVSNAYIML